MTLTTRPRLYLPLRDEKGDLLLFARVRIYEIDGKTPYTGKIYRDGTSPKTWSNPFVAAPALVSAYFTEPVRIRLGVQPDLSTPEKIGDPIDVTFDADLAVDTLFAQRIVGSWQDNGLLCGVDSSSAFWKPLRVDHEHATIAPDSILVGASDKLLRQVGSFPDTTTVGADTGGWGAYSGLRHAVMFGSIADGYGRGTVTLGRNATAEEGSPSPWHGGALAVGRDSFSRDEATAIGALTSAGPRTVAAGRSTSVPVADAVALGAGANPATNGVALGAGTGSSSRGMPGSIGVGAGAQYGLPSSTDPGDTAVLLGAYDSTRARAMPWTNPNGSQSESPWDEYTPAMGFTGRTVQLQRHLDWLADIASLQVAGDATLGGWNGLLGFYGATPRTQPTLGDDEPSSGIPALDNLIYALRELGLLRYRTEASITYRVDELRGRYLNNDRVNEWPEAFGTDTAVAVPGLPPTYFASSSEFNGHPSVGFDNSIYRRTTKPVAELRGSNLLPREKHFIAVACHATGEFGLNEGLLNLSYLDQVLADENAVLTGELGSGRWDLRNVARLEVDGLNQTANRDAKIPGPHVYAVTSPTTWPHARPIIGGPRDNNNQGFDRWSGQVAEIVGVDETWEPTAVRSLTDGLAFKYGISQSGASLRDPSKSFLLTQHDPMNGTLVYWKYDYRDDYLGKVQGNAIRVPKPVVYIPFISIYISFSLYYFRGVMCGNWGNIGIWSEYEMSVSIQIGDLDGDGDMEVDVDYNVSRETYVGVFALNSNFTWHMGRISCGYGYKVCRIRHRVTKVVVCINGDPPFRYADTDVKLYSTKTDGSLLLEATTPLWGDGTFKSYIKNPGEKVARVVERSTGNVLGTTEYQTKALPRTALYADDDPEVSFANRDRARTYESALTAMAILELASSHHYRARNILSTLRLVCNDDGTLNEAYSAVVPAKESPAGGAPSGRWGAVWTVLAVLRYQQVTGDGQFLPFARKLADKLISDNTYPETWVAAVAYFAFRDLAAVSGVTSYATAAQGLRTALLSTYWSSTLNRFRESLTSDAEALWADTFGGLFLLAVGDRDRARKTIQHLKRFRIKGASISAPHYNGPTGLQGYKPYADGGTTGVHTNPPNVIDQPGSWAAILFKQRFGEPTGDDVLALFRWQQTQITSDPTHDLYNPQFLQYSQNAVTAPYALRARPHLASAGWGQIMAAGARGLFQPDPLPAPIASGPVLSAVYDPTSGRTAFRASWTVTGAPAVAYELAVEQSVNAGSTWATAPLGGSVGMLRPIADSAGGAGAYATSWAAARPDNVSTIYRIRVRVRNASFGAWTTSSSVPLPPTS